MDQMEVERDIPEDDGVEKDIRRQSQLQEEYFKSFESVEAGQLVEGTIVQVTSDQVFVDVGCKSEGKIPVSEFSQTPKIGDTVSVVLITKENNKGEVVLSKKKADSKIFWKNLKQAFRDKTPVDGTIVKVIKGGYEVDLGCGESAFLPSSQSDVRKVEKPESLIGAQGKFLIEQISSGNKTNIVVNRRKYLDEIANANREKFFNTVQIGDEVTGVVKSFTSFGAFIDLGGFDGLLHINDMSWGHVIRPRDYVKKGQKINLKVIRLDPEEKKINLSLKHFIDDPWLHFEDKFHVGDIVKGKVTKLTTFGAFIELDEGVEGLAHISEFSWLKKISKPQDVLQIGEEVECMILGYDIQAGRVSLGLKQVTGDPWETMEERYPIGSRLKGKVVNFTNSAAFIEIEDGLDALLHADDMSWTKKIRRPDSVLEIGQEIEVMVIDIDTERRRIRVGTKQLSENPWKVFQDTHNPGDVVDGEVVSITDFGVFVRVEGDIEGLIAKSNFCETPREDFAEAVKKYNIGDKIEVIVLDVNPEKSKLSLSLRERVGRDDIARYMSADDDQNSSTYTLGSFLKGKEEE